MDEGTEGLIREPEKAKKKPGKAIDHRLIIELGLVFGRTITGAPNRLKSYLENCTVIKEIVLTKLLRAYGGCLGARSRRRTWKAAISFG